MKSHLFILLFSFLVISCVVGQQKGGGSNAVIHTSFGDVYIRIYDNTPEHKSNFEKLVKEGFYEGLLFHRVIQNFMVQGGDPDSKGAKPGDRLGSGSLDYTLPAEIVSENFHKRGAIAAARRGGPSNPEKRSSATQFYIVQGRVYTSGALDTMEMQKNQQILREIMNEQLVPLQSELEKFRANNDQDGFNLKIARLRERSDSIMIARDLEFKFSLEQREAYTTIGGYPPLDGDYTVFGEVVEGMEVIDKIAAAQTDSNDRPVQDISMTIEWLSK